MNHSEEGVERARVRRGRGHTVGRSPEIHRLNADEITKLHDEGYSMGEIAKETGLPRAYIATVMDTLRLKRRHGGSSLRGAERQRAKDLIRDLRLQGMSAPYIGNKLNLTTSQVSYFIRELREEGRLPLGTIPYNQASEIADALKSK